MAWGTVVFLFGLLWAVSISYSTYSIRRFTAWTGRGAGFALGTLGTALVTGIIVFRTTLEGESSKTLQDVLDSAFKNRDLGAIVTATSVLSGLSVSASIALLAAASFLLLMNAEGELASSDVRARLGSLDALLMLAAGLLVLGALEVRALYEWPGSYVAEALAKKLSGVAAAAATGVGTVYSVVLCAIYVPAAVLLRQVASRYAASPAIAPDKKAAWIQDAGIADRVGERFLRLATTLGPAIAGGPIASLLGLLGPRN